MRFPDAAIRAVRLSQHLEQAGSRAAPAQAAEPAILKPAVPAPHLQPSVPKGQACSRTPLPQVNCADAPAVAAQPRACSTFALRRRDAALLFQHNIQIDNSSAAFTSTVVLAGPRPAAESAHSKTLQFERLQPEPPM